MATSIRRPAAVLALGLSVGLAWAATVDGHYVAPTKHGINKDAMTMQECRERLAAPLKERPQSDDPRINLDAMCRNMLSSEMTRKPRGATLHSASAPGKAASAAARVER
jgi:hypothetical protein